MSRGSYIGTEWKLSWTAGVATNPGANMFGFGICDSNPEYANNFSDEVAVVLTQQTIIGNKTKTFRNSRW